MTFLSAALPHLPIQVALIVGVERHGVVARVLQAWAGQLLKLLLQLLQLWSQMGGSRWQEKHGVSKKNYVCYIYCVCRTAIKLLLQLLQLWCQEVGGSRRQEIMESV